MARSSRRKYWSKGSPARSQSSTVADPALFIAGFEYLPAALIRIRFRRRDQGRADRSVQRPDDRPAAAGARRDHPRRRVAAADRDNAARRPVRRIHRLLRVRQAPCPVMEVKAMHHRNDPILLGSPPMKPPRFHFGLPFRAACIWSNLETAGVTDVVGVWQHVAQLMTVVALKQRYAGHAKRAALIAAANSYMGAHRGGGRRRRRPSNLADVMWAITTRCEPAEQIDIVRNAWSSALDPRIPPDAKARGRHLALQGDHRGVPAVRLERQVSRQPRRSPPKRRGRSKPNGARRSGARQDRIPQSHATAAAASAARISTDRRGFRRARGCPVG